MSSNELCVKENDSDLDNLLPPIQGKSCVDRVKSFLKNVLLCKSYSRKNDTEFDLLCLMLQKAINFVTTAVEEDKKENYEEAIRLYNDGVKYFNVALSYVASSEHTKKSIIESNAIYLERIKKVKKLLQLKQNSDQTSDGDALSLDESADIEEDEIVYKQMKDTIMIKKPNIQWSDVAGLDKAKEALKEAVILPMQFPNLFTGNRKPPKGILLFGPPGTGKTFLAQALATEENNCTVLSVFPSHLVRKWNGESEKSVKYLFRMARQKKPSIIFIDYVDYLCNSNFDKESEAAKRMRAEFLLQMQGLGSNMDGILVLGATNVPWTLDADIRRSFTKRIYIPLPDETGRLHILKTNIGNTPNCLTEEDFKQLVKQTNGFSGADISALVQDALLQPIRKIQAASHFVRVSGPSRSDPNIMVDDLLTPCSPEALGAEEMTWMDVPGEKLLEPVISMCDMLGSLENSKPSVNDTDLAKLKKFMEDFGQQG